MIFPAVAEKRANNFRGLLFAAPGRHRVQSENAVALLLPNQRTRK